jgi:hypothetical protein
MIKDLGFNIYTCTWWWHGRAETCSILAQPWVEWCSVQNNIRCGVSDRVYYYCNWGTVSFFLCMWQRPIAATITSILFFANNVKMNFASPLAARSLHVAYSWPSFSTTNLPFALGIRLSITHTALMTWAVRLNPLHGILTAKERVIYPHHGRRPLMSQSFGDNARASHCTEQRARHLSGNKCVHTAVARATRVQAARSVVRRIKRPVPRLREPLFEVPTLCRVTLSDCSGGWRNSSSWNRPHWRKHMSHYEHKPERDSSVHTQNIYIYLFIYLFIFPVHTAVILKMLVLWDVKLSRSGFFPRFDASKWR